MGRMIGNRFGKGFGQESAEICAAMTPPAKQTQSQAKVARSHSPCITRYEIRHVSAFPSTGSGTQVLRSPQSFTTYAVRVTGYRLLLSNMLCSSQTEDLYQGVTQLNLDPLDLVALVSTIDEFGRYLVILPLVLVVVIAFVTDDTVSYAPRLGSSLETI